MQSYKLFGTSRLAGGFLFIQKAPMDVIHRGLNFLVAGAGFEPTTFGL